MQKFIAILQLLLCLILFIVAAAVLYNLVLISMRPETISVVNALIGMGVLLICLMASCRILYKKGTSELKGTKEPGDSSNDKATNEPGNESHGKGTKEPGKESGSSA